MGNCELNRNQVSYVIVSCISSDDSDIVICRWEPGFAGGVVVFYPAEKVRPTFVNYRQGIVMLLEGYTYNKSTRLNWYCSRRVSCGCKAKVKLTADEKYVERLVCTHDHLRENYVVSNSGNLIKLN